MTQMKRKNDKKYMIVSLFIVVLSLAVGYAIFAETLNITGTAQTTGNFDVEFLSATVSGQTLSTGASAVISGDKNTLTLAAPDLQLPGASVTYTVTVRNVGNIGAELLSVDVVGGTDPDVPVTFPTWTTGVTLAANGDYQFDIVVEWDALSSTGSKDITYTVDLNYQQAV
jgi:phage tail sheath gpL-like